jgi:outer membrane protein OmpA-like peptidoglycan-associated protein
VIIDGAVPTQEAADRLEALAVANAKGPAVVTSRVTIDPAVPADVGIRVIELQSLRFPSGSSEIVPEHAVEFDRVAGVMNALPDTTVLVIGHADQLGPEDANLTLSQARADAVVAYLVGQGIAADRLSAQGVGETDLLAEDLGEETLALNRRTEFVFYGVLVPTP